MKSKTSPAHSVPYSHSCNNIEKPAGLVKQSSEGHKKHPNVVVSLETQEPNKEWNNEHSLSCIATREWILAPSLPFERTMASSVELNRPISLEQVLQDIENQIQPQYPDQHIEPVEKSSEDQASIEDKAIDVEESKHWIQPDRNGVEHHGERIDQEFKIPQIQTMYSSWHRFVTLIELLAHAHLTLTTKRYF